MILDELVSAARESLLARQQAVPTEVLEDRIANLPDPCDILTALAQPVVSIIAEIKRASPSKGNLNLALDPAALAEVYIQAGACALSVLTESTRFRGSLADLAAVRAAANRVKAGVPLLRKDFITDIYQVFEARAYGADVVLLIAAALDDEQLPNLYRAVRQLGMTALVEVHNEGELKRAVQLGACLIGINNRDLRTFNVDIAVTGRLRPLVPAGTLVIAESGIHTVEHMRLLASYKVNGALIGEALVTAPDLRQRLNDLLEAGKW
ncbi:MAG: indole-3-glycerol phosphate synthase TrpC [Anaerolineae bacterium]